MSVSQWLMLAACILFIIGGVFTFLESRNWRVSVAMILLGIANALLLWEASK
jgi:uncharacterized protein YjeT (DUF2065 family)